MTGVWVLLAVMALAAVIAVGKRWYDGRFRMREAQGSSVDRRLTAADLGTDLGSRATLVQFSTSFCAPCRATRVLLAALTADRADVAHVEIDAEAQLDLVRRLGILRTPTVLVLDGRGIERGRASGAPRREQVEAVLAAVAP
ncbi:MAG: thioredoxin family protein [Aeromicrobium sp.]|uniref:TlpA family protein disulfide reductase n=1 Tax=Aeromicrobium sp. TaxID=1871063 RepID=UPI0039E5DB58